MERLEAKNRRRKRRKRRRRGNKCLDWKASMHENSCIFFPETQSRRMAAADMKIRQIKKHTIKQHMRGLCMQTNT